MQQQIVQNIKWNKEHGWIVLQDGNEPIQGALAAHVNSIRCLGLGISHRIYQERTGTCSRIMLVHLAGHSRARFIQLTTTSALILQFLTAEQSHDGIPTT